MNTAIIVAAGEGRRFGSDQPKQFVQLLGKPLILYTLTRFEACPLVDEIVLVLSASGRSEFETLDLTPEFTKLNKIITGGETRAESVKNGLDAIDAPDADVVAVHDGARPLVTVDEITRTIAKAAESGAACLVAEISDTVKLIRDDLIADTIDRRTLRSALTPQAFRYDILARAFERERLGEDVTDECYIVEKLGVEIAVVEGSKNNIKITRPADIILAEALLRQENYRLTAAK